MQKIVTSEWITANAGSGKTYTLTERVVRLLLMGVPPERIVCITYTKAAAAEMRSRVLDRLRELLLMEKTQCRARIEQLLGITASDDMLTHARSLFGQVLDSPSGGLVLTTIHGFCQNILRRFPLEAGIAPHFTVLEDAAAEELLRKAKHTLLTGLESADHWLTDALSLIGERGGEYRFETLASDIISKRRMWDDIWRAQSPASLRVHIYALHGLEEGTTRESLNDWVCSMPNEDDARIIRSYLPAMLSHSKKTEQKYGQGFAAWLEADADTRAKIIPDLCTLMLTDGNLRKDIPKLEHYEGAISRFGESVLRYHQQNAALACAEESFAVAVLAHELLDLYAQAKAATQALDYDDLITCTLNLMHNPDTLGWVMSKLDHRIDHLLIDEAQDNSGAQWQLAQALVEELIASNDGVGSAGLPRSLLVVGDEKQSIYSFQGAAPEQFQHNRRHFETMLAGSPSPLTQRALTNSYRSAQAVLTLVDHLCTQPEMAAAMAAEGEVERHQLIRKNVAGCVTLHPPIIAPEKTTRPAMTLPTEYAMQTTAVQMLAEEIASNIANRLNEKNATCKAGDILILVHRRKPLVAPLIRALQRRGVPVAGIDRLTLSEHLAVRDLLALMAWCLNQNDDLALAQVLRSPLIGWSDEQLRAAAFGRTGNLWSQISEPWLREMHHKRTLSPYDFLTEILETSGRRRAFARRFGEEVHEVLDELKAQAAAMPAALQPTLAEFYDWLSGSARTIKREQESGAADHVRIMTVHGAKGLEAPIVILADTVSIPTTQHERVFTMMSEAGQCLPLLAMSEPAKSALRLAEAKDRKSKKLREEYARLLYVALTRARDELHIFGSASKKGEVKAGTWYEAVESAMRALGAEEREGALQLRDAPTILEASEKSASAKATHPLPTWATTPPQAASALSAATLAPSSLMANEPSPYVARAASDAKERGVRIHRVLELLSATTTPTGIAALVQAIAPDWNADAQSRTVNEIQKLFEQEQWLWQHKRTPEASIAGTITHQGDAIPVAGQIDLLVETPDTIVILDYKTGTHVPKDASETPLNYLLQLKIYHALVTQLYPTKTIRCAILWTSVPRLTWLDQAVENTTFPDINLMLKTTVAA